MNEHIRWSDGPGADEATGRVGSLDPVMFRIWPPDEKGDRLLFVYVAGHQGDLYHGDTMDGLKAEAERLLTEFVSSLGAIFPEDSAVTQDDEMAAVQAGEDAK